MGERDVNLRVTSPMPPLLHVRIYPSIPTSAKQWIANPQPQSQQKPRELDSPPHVFLRKRRRARHVDSRRYGLPNAMLQVQLTHFTFMQNLGQMRCPEPSFQILHKMFGSRRALLLLHQFRKEKGSKVCSLFASLSP